MFFSHWTWCVHYLLCVEFDERQKRLEEIAGVNRPNDCSIICFVIVVGDDGNAYKMSWEETQRGGETHQPMVYTV